MPSPTFHLKFTTWCGPPQGYHDEPGFLNKVWPFLLEHSALISNVYLFKNAFFAGQRRWQRTFGKSLKLTLNSRSELEIIDLGPMSSLPTQLLNDLRHRSFYGGHLNVLYKADSEDFLAKLCRLWPTSGTISDQVDALGLQEMESDFLTNFLSSIPERYLVAAFGHDADPLYIFGSFPALTKLKWLAERRG